MTEVQIRSGGTLATTRVAIDGVAIDPSDLVGLQLYLEPQIRQVGCEINFNRSGRLERWVGANQDDAFDFELDMAANGVRYRLVADRSDMRILVSMPEYPDAPGAAVFPGSATLLQLAAEGWNLSINKFFRLTDPAEYQALLEGAVHG